MLATCLFALCLASPSSLPLYFHSSEDLKDASGLTLNACLSAETAMLIPRDPTRPKLWYAPVATHVTGEGVRVWYQRVHTAEADYADQRVLCLGLLTPEGWTLPAATTNKPVWGGPDNVVMRRSRHKPTWGGFNVFQILPHDGGYDMLYWDQPAPGVEAGAMLARSADGYTWTSEPGAVFTEHNDAFSLINTNGSYLLYQTALEDWPDKPHSDNLDKKRRVITLRRSNNLRDWTPQEPLLRPDSEDDPETEFYLMKAFRHGSGYLGLIMKYYADPALPGKHSGILKHELVSSPDGLSWQRFDRKTDTGFWSYADPVVWRGMLTFLTWKDNGLAAIRYPLHRLTAVEAVETGKFMTQPFMLPTTGIHLDCDTRGGWLEALPTDENGKPLAGAEPLRIEGVDGHNPTEPWQPSGAAPGGVIRLLLSLSHAKAYAVLPADAH